MSEIEFIHPRAFESTIMIPGFGIDPRSIAATIEHALPVAKDLGFHVAELQVRRGVLVLKGVHDSSDGGLVAHASNELARRAMDLFRAADAWARATRIG